MIGTRPATKAAAEVARSSNRQLPSETDSRTPRARTEAGTERCPGCQVRERLGSAKRARGAKSGCTASRGGGGGPYRSHQGTAARE